MAQTSQPVSSDLGPYIRGLIFRTFSASRFLFILTYDIDHLTAQTFTSL